MIYGLYLSASGVMASTYRQDVISNNLANSETVGFKRDLALFQARPTEAQTRGTPFDSDPIYENLGGGILATPTQVDTSQGELESTDAPLDVAIEGDGYFGVRDQTSGQTLLTRNGHFALDSQGFLRLSNSQGQQVLGADGNPIQAALGGSIYIGKDGVITQNSKNIGRVGLFDVPDHKQLVKQGGTLLTYPDPTAIQANGTGRLRSGAVENANVDPTSELVELMDTQRQLEANANMIQFQDQTLQHLCNDVGKIS